MQLSNHSLHPLNGVTKTSCCYRAQMKILNETDFIQMQMSRIIVITMRIEEETESDEDLEIAAA